MTKKHVGIDDVGLPVIDIRGRPGDTRFECATCGWSITLTPEGVKAWAENGIGEPTCREHGPLRRTVIGEREDK